MDKTIAMSLCLLCGIISPGAETPLKASWIWLKGADVHSYNQAVVARKEFRLAKPGPAALRITADSFYRLFINGNWVNDGPARSLPSTSKTMLLTQPRSSWTARKKFTS
jgi:hypothetical protein